jgi:hypothetical protein
MVGAVAGVVEPAGMVTVAGDTVALLGSLLVSVIVRADCGATETETCNGDGTPGTNSEGGAVTVIAGLATITDAVEDVKPGALAVMNVVPWSTPVTGTGTVVAPAEMVTVWGTVATLAFAELIFTVKPPDGATPPVMVRVRLSVCVIHVLSVDGVKAIVGAGTFTFAVAGLE